MLEDGGRGPELKKVTNATLEDGKARDGFFSRASQREGGLALKRGHLNGGQMKLILNFWTSEF